jgi:translocation and assembly module TamB
MSSQRISVSNLLQGVSVSDGTLAVRLDGDRARIDRLSLKGGEGTLSITGEAELNRQPRARLAVEARRFRVIGRVDRNAVVSGDAVLQLSHERGQLDGRFRLDEGLYDASRRDAPSLDDDVTVRRPGDEEPAVGEEATVRRNFALKLELDLGERLRVRGRGLDTGLRGELKLSTPGGRLAINGSVRTEQGTYAAYGQKLVIERGILSFAGPPEEPRLDILALRPNIDLRVGVAVSGTALAPRVRLFSEPEMGETEKLSWLMLGRAPDGLGRNDTALLQRAAVALLAGEGTAPTDQLMSRLGIDDLSLRQGDSDVRETVIILGKQLSRRWYLGYERGVNATTGTWQLTYRVAQRFTLRAQSGLENSLDAIWTWRFQETPADAAMRKSTVTPRQPAVP